MTEKKLAMEKTAKSTQAKLSKLRITPLKGTAGDWVRFENMFITQVDNKPITDEEKFGYLLELVSCKVRDKISNLKPGSLGCKIAWERLNKEYGQTRLVVNAHVDEIINLAFYVCQVFYETLSRNYDALNTLNEQAKLDGFVICSLNKLPHVKSDLVRTDDNWEEWNMENLIDNLQKWLRRNKTEEGSKPPNEPRRKDSKERNMYTQKGGARGEKKTPHCIFCLSDHWSDTCKSFVTTTKRKAFFMENNLF